MEEQPDTKKIFSGLVIGVAVIGLIIYGGYSYSQKKGGKLTLPAGMNYDKSQLGKAQTNPPTAPLRFTSAADTPWLVYTGQIYPYSFSYPQTLSIGSFPNDPSDSVGISWGNLYAQYNILLNVESIKDRDPKYVGKQKEYVQNWWKAFSGLKGVSSVDKFTNAQGLVGYKAIYINTSDQSPNVDVFFEVPKNSNLMIHIANGILDPQIFNRIVDSVKYTPQAAVTPTTNP